MGQHAHFLCARDRVQPVNLLWYIPVSLVPRPHPQTIYMYVLYKSRLAILYDHILIHCTCARMAYRIAGNFRGRKFSVSRISRFFSHPRKVACHEGFAVDLMMVHASESNRLLVNTASEEESSPLQPLSRGLPSHVLHQSTSVCHQRRPFSSFYKQPLLELFTTCSMGFAAVEEIDSSRINSRISIYEPLP